MAQGTMAKAYIIKKLQEIFTTDFLGESDGKIYVRAPEGGTKIQVAISLTCPKKEVEFANTYVLKDGGAFNLIEKTEEPSATTVTTITTTKSSNEIYYLQTLINKLGL